MSKIEVNARLRREKDILERIENVKRLIQMETTLLTAEEARMYCTYCRTDRDGKRLGRPGDDLLHNLRDDIQLQLLSITALCYGWSPDIGEPAPMLEWKSNEEFCSADRFRDVWEECMTWNA